MTGRDVLERVREVAEDAVKSWLDGCAIGWLDVRGYMPEAEPGEPPKRVAFDDLDEDVVEVHFVRVGDGWYRASEIRRSDLGGAS